MTNINNVLNVVSLVSLMVISFEARAASTGLNDKGTSLSASAGVPSIECINESEALVEFVTAITTTGSVDSAEIWTSLNKGEAEISGWIEPQDFVHNKRYKTAGNSFSEILPDGSYTVDSCYVQSGAGGRLPKKTCAPTVGFKVDCAPKSPCGNEQVFGDVVGNKNLCSGQALPIHIKGDFGNGGDLIISKGSFSIKIRADRSGNSCVYQAQYRPYDDGNAGAGEYTFNLVGDNTKVYSFTTSLKCR